jgi:hypothetical protein
VLALQAFAVLAGFTALRRIDRDHCRGGRPQAITGIILGAFAAAVAVMVSVSVQRWS